MQAKFSIWRNAKPVQQNGYSSDFYGVSGVWFEDGHLNIMQIPDITASFDEITFLVECLNLFEVSVFHVKDILEDYIEEKWEKREKVRADISFFGMYMA